MQFSRTSAPPMAINNPNTRTKSRSNKENSGTFTSVNLSNNQTNNQKAPNSGLKQPTSLSKLGGYAAGTASSRQKKFASSLNTSEQSNNQSTSSSNNQSKRSSSDENELISPSNQSNSQPNQSDNQSNNQSNNLFHDSNASTLAAIPATPIIRRSRLTMGDFNNQSINERDQRLEQYINEHCGSVESIFDKISSIYDTQFESDATIALKAPKITKEVKTLAQKREEEATKKRLITQTINGFKARKQSTLEIAAKADQTIKSEQRTNLTRIFDLTQKSYQSINQIKQLNQTIKGLIDEKNAIIADLQMTSSDKEKLDIIVKNYEEEKQCMEQSINQSNQEINQLNNQIEELQLERDDMKQSIIIQETSLINQSNKLSTLKREFDELTQSNNQAINELVELRSEIADLEDLRLNLLKSIEKSKNELTKKDQLISEHETTIQTQVQTINQLDNQIENLKQTIKQSEFDFSMLKKSKDDEIKQLNQTISQNNQTISHSNNQSEYFEKANSKLLIDIQQLRNQLLELKEQLTIEQSSNQTINQNYQLQSLELQSKINQLQSINQSINQERKMAEEERAAWSEERAAKQSKIDEINQTNNQSIKEIARLNDQIETLNNQVEQLTNQSNNQSELIESLKTDQTKLQTQIEELKETINQNEQTINENNQTINQTIKQSKDWQHMYQEKLTELEQFKRYAGVSDTDQLQNLVKLSVEAETLRAELTEKLDLINNQSNNQLNLIDRLKKSEEAFTCLNQKYFASEKARRDLHNTIQELKGNVRVMVRVRPPIQSNEQSNNQSIDSFDSVNCIECVDEKKLRLLSDTPHTFSFDHVFDQSTNQQMIFEEVSSFVQSALDGYHVCLFSYGQTCSGKTHTMTGSLTGENAGIIPRSIEQILKQANKLAEDGWTYSLEASFLEIYNENVRDLLCNKQSNKQSNNQAFGPSNNQTNNADDNLEIKRDTDGRTVVPGSVRAEIRSVSEIVELLKLANKNRSVAGTKMNERSSRSHSVFTLFLTGYNQSSNQTIKGSLNLCDLAGSERLSKSQAEGARLKETQAINKSLSALSDVFTHLNNQSKHIPFRNSKLTYLLQPCLQGDGKTLMIVNVSSETSNQGETLCSLRFAAQVNQCEVGKPKKSIKMGEELNQTNNQTIKQSNNQTEFANSTEHSRNNSGSSINQMTLTKKPTTTSTSRPTSSMSRR